MFQRKKINNDLEKRILTALITNARYYDQIKPILKINYFKVEYVRIIVVWILDYYENYDQAPGAEIENIFLAKKEDLQDEVAGLIQTFLGNLSEEFQREKFNLDYLLDQTEEYFKIASLENFIKEAKASLSVKNILETERIVAEYSQVARPVNKGVNPLEDFEFITQLFTEKEKRDELFQFRGELGKFIGPFCRGRFGAFVAPMKRGKSWWMIETAVSAIWNNCNVVFFSLEMSVDEVSKRVLQRITGLAKKKAMVKIPILDCELNQKQTCTDERNENDVKLFTGKFKNYKGSTPARYKACSLCKDKKEISNNILTTWFESKEVESLDSQEAIKKIKALDPILKGNKFKVINYPAKSKNIKDIKNQLTIWETEGFIPDVIIIDYADILAPENSRNDYRHNLDETWAKLKALAQEKHCYVLSASQSNKKTFEKDIKGGDLSEDTRKAAHCDHMVALNQNEQDKLDMIMRLSVLFDRHNEFHNSHAEAVVLQQFNIGKAYVDCYINYKEGQ